MLDAFDELVEVLGAGGDPAFQEVGGFLKVAGEAGTKGIVLREVEVDERVATGAVGFLASAAAWGCGLDESAREETGFVEKEERDLGDVGAGGDVDQVVVLIAIKGVVAGPVVEAAVDVGEVPGVATEIDFVEDDGGFGGDEADVGGDLLGEGEGVGFVEEFEAVDEEVFVLEERDAGSPFVPALGGGAAVELGAKDADGDAFHGRIGTTEDTGRGL